MEVERKTQKSLARKDVSTETHFLRIIGGSPSREMARGHRHLNDRDVTGQRVGAREG